MWLSCFHQLKCNKWIKRLLPRQWNLGVKILFDGNRLCKGLMWHLKEKKIQWEQSVVKGKRIDPITVTNSSVVLLFFHILFLSFCHLDIISRGSFLLVHAYDNHESVRRIHQRKYWNSHWIERQQEWRIYKSCMIISAGDLNACVAIMMLTWIVLARATNSASSSVCMCFDERWHIMYRDMCKKYCDEKRENIRTWY